MGPHSSPALWPAASAQLDQFRAIAALLVLAHHLRSHFFAAYADVQRPTPLTKTFYFVTGLGHQAVIVFFVLSGLLISASIVRELQQGRWSWKRYLINRLSRLYVVLLPALIVGGGIDLLGMHLFGVGGSYRTAARISLGAFLGNLFFLQDVLTPPFGTNAPLWSLSYEAWYYLIFPCVLLALLPCYQMRTRIALGAGSLALLAFVGREIALYFAIWLLGAGALLVPRRTDRVRAWVAWFLPLPALALARLHLLGSRLTADVAVALTFAHLLSVLHDDDTVHTAGRWDGVWAGLAHFSFTLYLIHSPVLSFLQGWLVAARGALPWQPTLGHLALAGLVAAVILALAWLLSLATEARTPEVRRGLICLLASARQPDASSV